MRRLIRQTVAGAFILCLGISQGGSVEAEEVLSLSLEDAIEMALNQNLGIQEARSARSARLAGVAEEEARFGRKLALTVAHRTDRTPSISSLENVSTLSTSRQYVTLGLTQNLTTGGRVDVRFQQNRSADNAAFRTVNPVYGSDLEVELTQPLLRGRGDINRTELKLAKYDLEQARVDLDGDVRKLKASVQSAYWDLVLAVEDLKVKRQLSDGGRRVLETVRTRVEMGAEPQNSILQAEVGVARREEAIILAEDRVWDGEDRLKTLMGIESEEIRLVPTQAPVLVKFQNALNMGIERALERNTDFLSREIAVEKKKLQVDVARDQIQPEVNLSVRAGLSGLGSDYSDDLKGLWGVEGRSWQGGFSLDIPLGASPDRERYHRRMSELEQTRRGLDNQKMQLVEQVRERFRQVHTDRRRADVAQLAEQLAERQVREEEDRLALGLSTVRQVLDAQDDLAEARASRLQAVVDYRQAMIAWEQVTGR